MKPVVEQPRTQERTFPFPSDFIPSFVDGKFSQTWSAGWGYRYLAYTTRVVKEVQALEFDSLIDIGCGDGRLLGELSGLFPHKRLVGIDMNERAIRFGQAFVPGAEFICGDIVTNDLPAGEQFDAATLIEVLEHIPPEQCAALVTRIGGCLRPRGSLVITVPTTKTPRVNPRHYRHFDRATLSALLSEAFEMQHVYFLNRVSFLDRLIGLALQNRLFILNEARLVTTLYSYYVRHLLEADEASAGRLLAVFVKR